MGAIDLKSNLAAAVSIVPGAYTAATVTGTGVDVSAGKSAAVLITTGVRTGGTYAFALEESDALSTGYTPVAAADLDGTFANLAAAGDASKVLSRVGYKGNKKFLRVVATGTSTPNANFSAVVLVGNPTDIPV